MPGNIQNATSTGTLPWSLSASFTETREWPALVSEYKDGSSQRREQAGSARKTYQLTKRLTPAAMTTLRSFYLGHLSQAFKVYRSRADYDAQNANFTLMRFEGGWSEVSRPGRSDVAIQLVEAA